MSALPHDLAQRIEALARQGLGWEDIAVMFHATGDFRDEIRWFVLELPVLRGAGDARPAGGDTAGRATTKRG